MYFIYDLTRFPCVQLNVFECIRGPNNSHVWACVANPVTGGWLATIIYLCVIYYIQEEKNSPYHRDLRQYIIVVNIWHRKKPNILKNCSAQVIYITNISLSANIIWLGFFKTHVKKWLELYLFKPYYIILIIFKVQ